MALVKIAVVTCYKQPDYIRARTLRAGLTQIQGLKTIIVKNEHKGFLKYPEVIMKLIKIRKNERPDAYLLTFRGQEILPFVFLIAWGKPVIFDEFIVPLEWATTEGSYASPKRGFMARLARMFSPIYRQLLARCHFILTDTSAHAETSARLSGVNTRQFKVIPVGTDETMFKVPDIKPAHEEHQEFEVFYYGSMLPLHGLNYVVDAAELLKDEPRIKFLVVGGGLSTRKLIRGAKKAGVNISYQPWLPFEELPQAISQAQLCLAGPFGNTPQAQQVITGKTFQFLACQVPTLVGKNLTNDLFENRVNSLVVAQANAEELASSIRWAYTHPQELASIAVKGRALYEKHYSTQVISEELKDLIDQLP